MKTIIRKSLAGMVVVLAGVSIAGGPGSASASASGNVKRGKVLFLQCAACHAITPEGPKKVGPNLHGVVGAKAAAREDFKYSAAMQAAAKKGLTWDHGRLDKFLANPRAVVPGNGMVFGGMSDPAKRADIIAYLKSPQS